MTCHYLNSNWLDVLYSDVRRTQGGVADAARFLTERRGRSIHPESLRSKLRGLEGEALSMEMAELLGEWMEEKAGAVNYAWNWLQVLCMSRGLHVDYVPPGPENGWPNEAAALQAKFMETASHLGAIAATVSETVADGVITKQEADALVPMLSECRIMLHRMERNAYRAGNGNG